MADCFADDSTVDMSWFTGSGAEFVNESRRMSGRGDHAVHRLSPPTIHVEGHRALAELPLTIEFRVNIGGIEADLASHARSQYRAQRTDGSWRIARITSIYERDTLIPSVPGARLDIDPQELTTYRPSYRCLAWYLSRLGYHVGADLLGDDQPEAVARQYEAKPPGSLGLSSGGALELRREQQRSARSAAARVPARSRRSGVRSARASGLLGKRAEP